MTELMCFKSRASVEFTGCSPRRMVDFLDSPVVDGKVISFK